MPPISNMQHDAMELYNCGELDEALALIRPALRQSPDDGRLWELCGLIHRQRNDCPPCLHALEQAMVLVPLSFTAQCALADCYVFTERHELAADLYRHLLEQVDRLPDDLLKNLSVGFESLGDNESALRVSRAAAERMPESAEHRYAAAYFMGQLGYPVSVVAEWACEAVQLAPNNAQYRIGLAGLMHASGDLDEAYRWIRELTAYELQTVPCGKCLTKLARIYGAAGDEFRKTTCQSEMEVRTEAGAMHDCGGCE